MMSLSRPAVDVNNNSLGFNYTATQVGAALKAPMRRLYFRYNLLDVNGNFKKQLTGVTSGWISYDYTQSIKRTATFTLEEDSSINYLSDRVQPFALLYIPPTTQDLTKGGAFAQFPLGVFLLSTPPRQTDSALVVTRQIQAYDLNQILNDWKTTDRYTISAGVNYMTAVQNLLTSAKITNTNLTATSLTLQTALNYAVGTPYLTIINDLLTQINYRTLWFDENGVAIAQPWVNPSAVAPEYTYADDSESVTMPTVQDAYDLFSVPNVWIVTVSQAGVTAISSTYTNSNSLSPTSTTNRGRQIVSVVANTNAPNTTTLGSIAQQIAFNDSQVYEMVTFQTAIMPFHQDYDVVQFSFSTLGISANFSEFGWSFPLQAGGTMQHTVRKIVPV